LSSVVGITPRTFLREPAVVITAVAVLALGIGSSTAIFTVLQKLVLEPLPFAQADRLQWISRFAPGDPATLRDLTGPEFTEFQKRNSFFEKTAAIRPGLVTITGPGEPELVQMATVTQDFFPALQGRIAEGRLFHSEEYVRGHNREAILTYQFWQRYFRGDPGILGKQIDLDGLRLEVVGILALDFPLDQEYQVLSPLVVDSPALESNVRAFRVFGRLKANLTASEAKAEAQSVAVQLGELQPAALDWGFRLIPFSDKILGNVRQTLWALTAAVACLLLIVCANATSLFLARSASRAREMAIRAALGAQRRHLIAQLLGESILMALLGGVLSYPLALLVLRTVLLLDPSVLPRLYQIRPDIWTLVFCVLLSVLTGLAFGAVPAWRASRVDLQSVLREGDRSGSASRRSTLFRASLVSAQVALGVVLLTISLLMARSMERLSNVPAGFEPRGVLTFQVTMTGQRHRRPENQLSFYEELIRRLELLPGVNAVGSSILLPLDGEIHLTSVWLDSQPEKSPRTLIQTDLREVTPGFFAALGIPLRGGRMFTWADRSLSPSVAIVNRAFEKAYYPAGAVGRRLIQNAYSGPRTLEIVGVAEGVRDMSLSEEPRPELFLALAQSPVEIQAFVVRANGVLSALTPAIRREAAAVDPLVPIENVRTMQENVNRSISTPRLRSTLLALFAGVAVFLSALGLYGLISLIVVERRREIGIRMALGAQLGAVRRMVVANGLAWAAAGVAAGLAGAYVAARWIESLLYGVQPGDMLVYLAATILFLGVAAAASYLPVRRITSSEPMIALREE
jgi:putative ABC transport system permease protein